MLKKILYLVEALLTLILVCASGLGLFVLISFLVYEYAGPEWLRVNAMLVFFLTGFLISMGFIKLLQIVQYQILQFEGEERIQELTMDEETRKLLEHLGVR